MNKEGRGPAWSNSLFEDNAEFGMGMRLAVDKQKEYAEELVQRMASIIGEELAVAILSADQSTEEGIFAQRERVKALKDKLANDKSAAARDLLAVADELVKKSVWIIGGDGWGYDIGFGGLDHVLASTPTSTSCCSIPRCTPTPAGRCRRPRRWVRWRSLPPAASALPRKTSP